MNFRVANESDLPQLQRLGLLAYGEYKDISDAMWVQWSHTFNTGIVLSHLLQIGCCYVCESNNRIVGMAFLIPSKHPTELFSAEWSYIRLVAVHPDVSGKGIGRKLTQLCIDKARQNGEHTVALHTSEFQHAARHLYESIGFEKHRDFIQYDKTYWIYLLRLVDSADS